MRFVSEATEEGVSREVSNNVMLKACLSHPLWDTRIAKKRVTQDAYFQLLRHEKQISVLSWQAICIGGWIKSESHKHERGWCKGAG